MAQCAPEKDPHPKPSPASGRGDKNERKMQTPNSNELFKEAQQFIPGGVNSPVRAFKSVGGVPRFIKKAQGPYIFDSDDNRYIDYIGSWGPMIAGHNHPHILKAVQKAVENGLSFGAPCPDEVLLAKKVCALMPSIEKVRFVNSGTEATMSALRLARAATKRNKFIKFAGCYHGHADSFLVAAGSGLLTFGHPSSPGVPQGCTQDTLIANFNDLDSVQKWFEKFPRDIAAIILEPIAGNMNLVLPRPGFLQGLRELCDKYGALLIIDEVMTGFRVAQGGAQELFKIKADLTTLGKIIGGGMPVGAFGGREDLMDQMAPLGPVYQAGTLSGNPIAMAAGLASLELIEAPNFFENLNAATAKLMRGLQERADAAKIPFFTQQVCGMFGFYFSDAKKIENLNDVKHGDEQRFNRFFHGMLDKNVYFAPSMYEAGFISSAHDETIIAATLDAAEAVFAQ